MQTFLPEQNYKESAKCLDRQRLGKQRVECLQIMKALTNKEYGWQNHPAVNMWRGLNWELYLYTKEICDEWIARGYKDTCWEKFRKMFWKDFWDKNPLNLSEKKAESISIRRKVTPVWKGDDEFHNSHKSNLLRKNPEHYSQFNWGVKNDLNYKWFNEFKDNEK